MIFSSVAQLNKRKDAELIICPFWQREKLAKAAAQVEEFQALFKKPLEVGDFTGKVGETLFLYPEEKGKEKRVLLLGLGKEADISVETLRIAFSNAAKRCQTKAISHINVVVPDSADLKMISLEDCLRGITEGILLTNYRWEKLAKVQEETVLLKQVTLIGISPKMLSVAQRCEEIAEGVYFARDLVNGNADIITPMYLAESAKKISEKFAGLTLSIFDQKRIEEEKMGFLQAVARGSAVEPAFIILSYKGNPHSHDHTILVGKGVTFDTGGLNLKPTGSMETMRDDMAGAATVLATVATAAALKLQLNVTACIPAAENGIDAKSYKPGDVYKGHAGVTVEIGNTDAEGRLILADALSYCVKHLKPTRMIDVATLTGAMVVALGEGVAGFFSNDDKLALQLIFASKKSAENIWRMPLHLPYKELIKSDIADLKNTGGRPAGSVTAALFLHEFVGETPWAHIDIAGVAFAGKENGYIPKNGVGFGVRLFIEFLEDLI